MACDAPEAPLAHQHKRFAVHCALRQAVREHRQGVEPLEAVDPPGFQILAHGQRVEEERLVSRCARLRRRYAVEDGLGVNASVVPDGPKSLLMSLEELECRMSSNQHLIEAARNEIALAHGIDEAQPFGSIGAADNPRMFSGVPVQHLASDVLACSDGGR